MLAVGGCVKFVLITIAVAALAGGGAFVATSAPAGRPSELAGDWRCNEMVNGIDCSILLSVAHDGATRAQFLLNTPYKDRWVIVNLAYTGTIRIEGDDLVQSADNIRILHGSVDGQPLPESIKAAMLKEVSPGSARYHIDTFAGSKLRYSDEQGRAICERSPVKLNL